MKLFRTLGRIQRGTFADKKRVGPQIWPDR